MLISADIIITKYIYKYTSNSKFDTLPFRPADKVNKTFIELVAYNLFVDFSS